jgi:CheY-like chemotaxis protein
MEKTLLLIDDSPEQKTALESLAEHLRTNDHIKVHTIFVDPNEREYLDDQQNPDLDKLILGIASKLIGLKPNLIVVDQYYGDSSFTGLDVIEKLRSIDKFKKCKIFLISGKRAQIISEVFEGNNSSTEKISKLAKIIDLKIEKFLDKEFKSEAIQSLKTRELNDLLLSKLREADNGKIHVFNPTYNTLDLDQLANLIDANSPRAQEILNEIFDLTLSHYIKFDENLQ